MLTLKICLINFITKKGVHSNETDSEIVVLSTDYIFHNLQDDVEFDLNHKLRQHSGARSPTLEA